MLKMLKKQDLPLIKKPVFQGQNGYICPLSSGELQIVIKYIPILPKPR
jgi:hypothetical protein